MFLKLKNTTFQSITSKIYDFVTPLLLENLKNAEYSHLYKVFVKENLIQTRVET